MTEENNEAAAPAAVVVDDGETNMVHHPNDPQPIPDPVPDPPGDKLVAGGEEAAAGQLVEEVHNDLLNSEGPHDGVTEQEIVDLRESALEDAALSNPPVRYATPEEEKQISDFLSAHYERAKGLLDSGLDPVAVYNQIQAEVNGGSASQSSDGAGEARTITLGQDVYYGDGTGNVWAAKITHVYSDGDELEGGATAIGGEHVDLQVFKRQHIVPAERVLRQTGPGLLNGWVFKA